MWLLKLIADLVAHGVVPVVPEFPRESIYAMQDMTGAGIGLKDYPLVDQLHEPTSDGKPDENKSMNCVFASYASVIKFLHREYAWVNGDYIKDHSAYGQGYVGGSAGERIAPYVEKKFYVKTEIIYSQDRAYLMQRVLDHLAKGLPVLITIPSAWNSVSAKNHNVNKPNYGTHCVTAYHSDGKNLSCMNPWGGFIHTQPISWWTDRLCWAKVYLMWPLAVPAGDSTESKLPDGWKDDGTTLTAPNGVVVISGFRKYILANGWDTENWPVAPEQAVASVEQFGHPELGAGSIQFFRKCQLSWTQAQGVFQTWTGQELYATRKNYGLAA